MSTFAIVLGVFAIGFVAIATIGQPATADTGIEEDTSLQVEETASTAGTCGANGGTCEGSCGGSCGASSCGCGK